MPSSRAGLILVSTLLLCLSACLGSGGDDAAGARQDPRTLVESRGPWPLPVDAGYWIARAGLKALGVEQFEYHVHAHLRILVDEQPLPVPALLGIDRVKSEISPVHTHDATGVIHVESLAAGSFTLGQFFTQWGVRLDERCVGGYCWADRAVAVYVDGKPSEGNPASVELRDRSAIVIVIGRAPAVIPASYEFPFGL